MVISSSPERSNAQSLVAAMSSTAASGLFLESIPPTSSDMPSRSLLFAYVDTHAQDGPVLARRGTSISQTIHRACGSDEDDVLRGSSDVICGIGATPGGVRPQAKHASSTTDQMAIRALGEQNGIGFAMCESCG